MDAFYSVLKLIRLNFPLNSSNNTEIQTNLEFYHAVSDEANLIDNDDDELTIYDDDNFTVQQTDNSEVGKTSENVNFETGVDDICEQLSELNVKKKSVFQTLLPGVNARKKKEISYLKINVQKSRPIDESDDDFSNVNERIAFSNNIKLIISSLDTFHQFPPSLSKSQRQIIHNLAEEANLDHFSLNTGAERFITIKKKSTYSLRKRK